MHTPSEKSNSPTSITSSDVSIDVLISLFQAAHLSPSPGGFLPDDKLTLPLIEQAYTCEFPLPVSTRDF